MPDPKPEVVDVNTGPGVVVARQRNHFPQTFRLA
jgi:hypothetical protein